MGSDRRRRDDAAHPFVTAGTRGGRGLDPMTRDEVFGRIRAHLAEELEVDPGAIGEDTRFREDLRADSLHLVELVVELEDSYGVRIPDDEAVKLKTVGQAADFVAAHAPEAAS